MRRCIRTGLFAALFVAGLTTGSSAQPTIGIELSPVPLDFGMVELFTTGEEDLLVRNTGATPIEINYLWSGIGGMDPSAFSFVSMPTGQIGPGGSVSITIAFSPEEGRPYSATLTLYYWRYSNGTPMFQPPLNVPLQGQGGVAEKTPEEMMVDAIDFFDAEASEDGLIGASGGNGKGKGKSSDNSLKTVRNMLVTAEDLIVSGDYDAAIGQLTAILKHADGLPRPPDKVSGPAQVAFAEMLMDLIESLGG